MELSKVWSWSAKQLGHEVVCYRLEKDGRLVGENEVSSYLESLGLGCVDYRLWQKVYPLLPQGEDQLKGEMSPSSARIVSPGLWTMDGSWKKTVSCTLNTSWRWVEIYNSYFPDRQDYYGCGNHYILAMMRATSWSSLAYRIA